MHLLDAAGIASSEHTDAYPKKSPRMQYKIELVWRNIILFMYLHVAAIYGAYLMVVVASWPTVIWDAYPKKSPRMQYKIELVWRNIILFMYLHVAAIYGAYLMVVVASWPTVIWDAYPKKSPRMQYKIELVWRNIILFMYLHVAAIYGAYLMVVVASWPTVIWDAYPKKSPRMQYKIELVWRNIILFMYLHVAAIYGAYLMVVVASWPTVIWDAYPKKSPRMQYKIELVWRNIILFMYLHVAAIYGAYLMVVVASWPTVIWAILLYICSVLGVTAGVHRLWSHRAYKAKLPLQLILLVFNTLAFQNDVIEWARDHRVHHKYTETDADPHNANRGFFFSHVGWLLCRKHPDVIQKGKRLDISDLEKNPLLKFQQKYYLVLMPLTCFLLPTAIPAFCWGETWTNAWHVAALFRYTFTLHMAWFVNSAAHFWGQRPYDQSIKPCDSLGVSLGSLGEGWHNYHHTFPWDYKAAELGNYGTNFTTAFIDFFAKIGWAYDLKTVSKDVVKKRVQRTGDGTHRKAFDHKEGGDVWGWGDRDMAQEQRDNAKIINRKPNISL